ncbi:MAG: Twinfilin-1 [Watsoniomyces obsoletus]|nr:MAG: Twinfilin-1 [Watsoniomyces obsoletus]
MSSTTEQPRPRQYQVRLEYSKPGTQPPVFLAGSFSDPAWQPYEMSVTEHCSENAESAKEYSFHKEMTVDEGRWQYKFRLGHGDWWVLDDGAKTATDEAGHVNNIFVVHGGSQQQQSLIADASPQSTASSDMETAVGNEDIIVEAILSPVTDTMDSSATPSHPFQMDDFSDDLLADEDLYCTHNAPILAHEALIEGGTASLEDDVLGTPLELEDSSILLEHEAIAPRSPLRKALSPIRTDAIPPRVFTPPITITTAPTEPAAPADETHSHEDAVDHLSAHLPDADVVPDDLSAPDWSSLRASDDSVIPRFVDVVLHSDDAHVTPLAPSPLFTHECIGSRDAGSAILSSCSSTSSRSADEHQPVDVEWSRLERFPQGSSQILDYIQQAEGRLHEDLTSDDDESKLSSPVHMPATPTDNVSPHRGPPSRERSPHLEKIPEDGIPELETTMDMPSRIAFNMEHRSGIVLGQDLLFDGSPPTDYADDDDEMEAELECLADWENDRGGFDRPDMMAKADGVGSATGHSSIPTSKEAHPSSSVSSGLLHRG